MADFSGFLAKISQLEECISIPIPVSTISADSSISDFSSNESSFYSTSHGFETGFQIYDPSAISQFSSQQLNGGADLSVFIEALKKSSTCIKRRIHRKPPVTPGIPVQFFCETNVPMLEVLLTPVTADAYEVCENVEPTLETALKQCPAGSVLLLKPGIYQKKYVVSKPMTIRAAGEVIFDSESPVFTVMSTGVIFENINFRHGRILVVKGSELQLSNCKTDSTIFADDQSKLICRGCSLSQKDDNCIAIKNSSCMCVECDVRGKGIIAISNSTLFIAKCKIEEIADNGVQIDDSLCRIEDSFIGDTDLSCIHAVGKSDVSISGTQIYSSENGSLIEASTGAVAKIKNCTLSGECKNSIDVSAAGAILCENISFKRNCHVENDGLIQFRQCQIFSITCNAGRLMLSGCDVLCTSGCGLLAEGTSDLVINGSSFHNCRSNGIETSELTSITATNTTFTQNACGGASISSSSALFRNCQFTSNAISGVEIVGYGASPVFDTCQFVDNAAVDATCFEETSPTFNSCRFNNSDHLATAIVGSSALFDNCVFSQAQQIAADISQGATPKFSQCTFEGGNLYAIQCKDENTHPEFVRCSFKDTKTSSAVLLIHHGDATFASCNFSDSGVCHVEIRDEAHAFFEGCVFAGCTGGIGIFAHNSGTAEFSRTAIKDLSKAGVFVGARSKVSLTECEVLGCGEVGIAAELQSALTLKYCTLKHNGHAGIQAEGGDINIDQCIFEEHSDFGIYATALATVVQTNNTFNENGKGDTQIG